MAVKALFLFLFLGNFEKALEITNEMLLLKPQHKGVLKAKATIESTLKKETTRAKNKRLKRTEKNEKPKKVGQLT